MSPKTLAALLHDVRTNGDEVRTKVGRTNGRSCVHLIGRGYSETIYDPSEWYTHRDNRNNKPRKREEEYED